MSTQKLSNISVAAMRDFLIKCGCTKDRTEGGHEVYVKEGLTRPIVLQSHITPVPEFIVKNILRNLGLTRKDFLEIIR
jgi:predicted RNA binding protein YcfA (HicA-like mRNA interferase family)